MSDLVGDPEARFSSITAQLKLDLLSCFVALSKAIMAQLKLDLLCGTV